MQDGKRLIVVVSGLEKADQRKDEAAKLLDWGFRSFSEVKVFDDGEIVGKARVWGGKEWYVPLAPKGDVMFTLPKYPANQKLSAEIVYKAPLKPPVKKAIKLRYLKLQVPAALRSKCRFMPRKTCSTAGSCGKASIHLF